MKLNAYVSPVQNNFKWIKYLNVISETLGPLKESIGERLQDIDIVKDLLKDGSFSEKNTNN